MTSRCPGELAASHGADRDGGSGRREQHDPDGDEQRLTGHEPRTHREQRVDRERERRATPRERGALGLEPGVARRGNAVRGHVSRSSPSRHEEQHDEHRARQEADRREGG